MYFKTVTYCSFKCKIQKGFTFIIFNNSDKQQILQFQNLETEKNTK